MGWGVGGLNMRRDYREKQQPLVMIIPMIDIMLFLLVFFMISTIYMVQTNTIQVSLPHASKAVRETRPGIVPITVTGTGDILYDKDTVPSGDLAKRVKETLEADSETVFVLRGDRSVPYEHVVYVLDILKKSGTKNISIATEVKEGS